MSSSHYLFSSFPGLLAVPCSTRSLDQNSTAAPVRAELPAKACEDTEAVDRPCSSCTKHVGSRQSVYAPLISCIASSCATAPTGCLWASGLGKVRAGREIEGTATSGCRRISGMREGKAKPFWTAYPALLVPDVAENRHWEQSGRRHDGCMMTDCPSSAQATRLNTPVLNLS